MIRIKIYIYIAVFLGKVLSWVTFFLKKREKFRKKLDEDVNMFLDRKILELFFVYKRFW